MGMMPLRAAMPPQRRSRPATRAGRTRLVVRRTRRYLEVVFLREGYRRDAVFDLAGHRAEVVARHVCRDVALSDCVLVVDMVGGGVDLHVGDLVQKIRSPVGVSIGMARMSSMFPRLPSAEYWSRPESNAFTASCITWSVPARRPAPARPHPGPTDGTGHRSQQPNEPCPSSLPH